MAKYRYYIEDVEVDEEKFTIALQWDSRIDDSDDYLSGFERHLDLLKTNADNGINEPQEVGFNTYYISL